MKKNTFSMIDKDGKETFYDVLFTFDNDETKKSYIVYTDNTRDKDDNIQVYASIYDKDLEEPNLEPITTEKEWKIIETILNTLQEEIKNKKDEQ